MPRDPAESETATFFIATLFGVILRLLRAGTDRTAQEEALMEGQEAFKREIDRRKFSDETE